MSDRRLEVIVFARAPRPGHTKTRLIPALGAEGAAALHGAFLEDTLDKARALLATILPADAGKAADETQGGRLVLAHPPDVDRDEHGLQILHTLAARHGAELRVQEGEGLAERMQRSLARSLVSAEAALIVGSDAPTLPRAILRAAFQGLARTPGAYALGPASDGGYVLVGASERAPCFDDIRVGTPHAYRDTVRANGSRPLIRLSPWYDVDRPEDLRLLLVNLRADPKSAPATAKVAAKLGLYARTW